MTLLFTDSVRLFAQALEARDESRLSTLILEQPDYFSRAGPALLSRFAGRNDVVAMEALVARGAIIDALTPDGETALCDAARAGALDALRWLLARGANAEGRKDERRNDTPLIAAAEAGRLTALEELLAHGADVAATKGDPKRNALDWAVYNGFSAVAARLQAAGATKYFVGSPKPDMVIDRRDGEIGRGALDIAMDARALRDFFAFSCARFNDSMTGGAAGNVHVLVSLQSGFVEVGFSVDAIANPFASFSPALRLIADLPHWRDYYALLDVSGSALTTLSGAQIATRPPPQSEAPSLREEVPRIQAAIGGAIAAIGAGTFEKSAFAALRKRRGCLLTVQDDEDWNWPNERDLGKINTL